MDDKLVCELSDNQYKGNFVGLWLGSNIDASFDDFMISDRTDDKAFDVSPVSKLATAWGRVKQK